MQTWEYRGASVSGDSTKGTLDDVWARWIAQMNLLGSQGFELVTEHIFSTNTNVRHEGVFKKLISD
jgi:hypothetical protein